MIRPRSMLFTLYGDYAVHRGGEVWVGSLITIASQFGLSEQAVRSALSRMARSGWLRFRRVGKKSYYSLTARSKRLIEEGSSRIFRRRTGPWDGRWHILTYSIPERKRASRDELRKRLTYLGFAPLSSGTWISPHDLRREVESLAGALGIRGCVELFTAQHLGFTEDRELAARCWDLTELSRRYTVFLNRYRPAYEAHQRRLADGEQVSDGECFVQRFLLIHEYRRFFFMDPDLPDELLPQGWPGREAAELFQAYHNLLADKANRYFDAVFDAPPARRKPSAVSQKTLAVASVP